jgi:hypothetical protein
MAKVRLKDAMLSPIYMCGMAPLDSDDPSYNGFLAEPSMDCDTHIESNFYVSRVEPTRLELCCHCAGVFYSIIDLNTQLKAPMGPYGLVLPICNACTDSGCYIIVRAARANANAIQSGWSCKMQCKKH